MKPCFTEEQVAAIHVIVHDDIKLGVHDALTDFFSNKSTTAKNIIVQTAIVVTSLGAIAVGFKYFLGVLGFSYISKL